MAGGLSREKGLEDSRGRGLKGTAIRIRKSILSDRNNGMAVTENMLKTVI
jgi:hypothetical protein